MQEVSLRPYQHTMIDYLQANRRCNLFVPMGLGKTVSVLTALDNLSVVEDVFPVLVLAPLRVAKNVWKDEVAKWPHLRHLTVSPIVGTAKEREEALAKKADIFCCNYENLVWLTDRLGDNWKFKTVIADECSKLKAMRTRQGGKRSAALAKFAHSKVTRYAGLTGTPCANSLADLWALCWFVDSGQRLGKSFHAFQQRWFKTGWDGYSIEPLPTAQKEIEDKIKDICFSLNVADHFPVKEPIVNKIFVELPSLARKQYKEMEREFFTMIEANAVEAFNSAAKSMKCIAEGTPVLTMRGWVAIETLRQWDVLWDGEEWVNFDKLLYNGYKNVICCLDVFMTPDHLVLTKKGWVAAKEICDAESCERYERYDVRLPDSYEAGCEPSQKRIHKCFSHLDSALRLWERIRCNRVVPKKQASWEEKVLRMSQGGNASGSVGNSWDESPPGVPHLVRSEGEVLESERQGLEELRSPWDKVLRKMEKFFREFLGRHGGFLGRGAYARQNECERNVHKIKLSMGHRYGTGKQYSLQHPHRDSVGETDYSGGCEEVGSKINNTSTEGTVEVAAGETVHTSYKMRVYDILNCGVRNRFVVKDSSGKPLIVHNCLQLASGCVYTDQDGDKWSEVHTAKMDALEDIVEEAMGSPIMVAYNFRSDKARILKKFPKAVDLSTDAGLKAFRTGTVPIGICHPMSLGHGVDGLQNVTNTLVFFSSDWNLENHLQLIERIGSVRQLQSGQDRPTVLHHIIAKDTIDELVLERLTTKRKVQDILLAALKARSKQ